MPIDKSFLKKYEDSIAAIEPTPGDLKIYRRMGLDTYVSPSGKRYPLIQDYFSPQPQKRAFRINKELLESFEAGEHEDVKKNKAAIPIPDPRAFGEYRPEMAGIDTSIADPKDISLLKAKTFQQRQGPGLKVPSLTG